MLYMATSKPAHLGCKFLSDVSVVNSPIVVELFIDAQQAKLAYQYKKRKLYKTNAAIWYNKTCRQKRLTPKYINIRINGDYLLLTHLTKTYNLS
jgi:hypothetical protein